MSKQGQIELYKNPDIAVRSCEWGFGVFATGDIEDNIILEECHYIRYKSSENKSAALNDYVFRMANPEDDPEEAKFNGLVLGYGSIFNHSNHNNAAYYMDTQKNVYVFHSIRKIKKGEQITISYGGDWWTSRNKEATS